MAVSDFKAKCLGLIDQVKETGEEIVITKRGVPVARLAPLRVEKPWLHLQGSGQIVGDIISPVIEESDIEALK